MLETLGGAALLLGPHTRRRPAVPLRSVGTDIRVGRYAHGIALIISVALVSSAIDLPLPLSHVRDRGAASVSTAPASRCFLPT